MPRRRRFDPIALQASIGTDALTLLVRHACDVHSRARQAAPPLATIPPVPALSKKVSHAARPLLKAIALQPSRGGLYEQLGALLGSGVAKAELLWAASALQPYKANLNIEAANALKDAAQRVFRAADGRVRRAVLVRLELAFAACLRRPHIAQDAASWANHGMALYRTGRLLEAEHAYRSALALMPAIAPAESATAWPDSWNEDQSGVSLRAAYLDVLAGLDNALTLQRKHVQARQEVHSLGRALGLWPVTGQRPPNMHEGRALSACPWHSPAAYGRLTTALEERAAGIRSELAALLRARAVGGAEAQKWYTDPEGVSMHRPEHWWRRKLRCLEEGREDSTLNATCEAVRQAAAWYSPAGGGDAALFSVLLPGTYIGTHVGPTNGRLAVALGLSGTDGVTIRVADTCYSWPNGRAVVFDDSFEHEVWHRGSTARAALFLHLEHPQLVDSDAARGIAAALDDERACRRAARRAGARCKVSSTSLSSSDFV